MKGEAEGREGKGYADFLEAVKRFTAEVRPILTANDIWIAATRGGFKRDEIIKHYGVYRGGRD